MSELSEKVFEAILMARQRVYEVSGATPFEEIFDESLPFRLFVKREDLGPIKAYKWRGAYNKIAALSAEERSRGIVAASAGNHAQGVALAAKKLGIFAKIFMPTSTPEVKQRAVKRFGGEFVEIVLHGEAYDAAGTAAKEDAKKNNLTFINPYDDLDVMGGQGTLAEEIVMSGKGPFDVAFLQIGGGGMAAAAAVWLKKHFPEIKIVGVEGENQASMKAAISAGTPIDIGRVDIFCDGTAVRKAGNLTFEICREFLDEIVTVTNEDVCWAIQKLWETNRIIPETSGAMGVAAALKLAGTLAGKKVLTVISGANVDFGQLGVITRNSQINGAVRRALRLEIPQAPGSLSGTLTKAFSSLLITEFQYGKTNEKLAFPTIGVAASNEQFQKVTAALDAEKIRWEEVTSDEDTLFRAVAFDRTRAKNPIFIRLDFYERAGALNDFLKNYVSAGTSICYFNYLYTGERVGRALLGFEFPDENSREIFRKKIAEPPKNGVRTCSEISENAARRLSGNLNF